MSNLAPCTKSAIDVPPQGKFRAPLERTLSVFDMKTYGMAKARQQLHRKLCGSAETADLYREVTDPFTRTGKDGLPLVKNTRDGCYWWGVTVSRLARKLGWTEHVTKYRLKVLRQRGMIATCAMRTPKNMMQVRPLVAGGSALLNGWPDASNYEHLYCAWRARGQPRKGSQCEVHPFYRECETHPFLEGEEFTLFKSLGLFDLGLEEVGLSLHAQIPRAEPDENPETPQGKPTATLEAVPTACDVEKISEVVSQKQSQIASPIALAPPQKDSAHAIWEREFLLTHPGGYIAFKDKDRRLLRTVAGKLPSDLPYALFVSILMGTGRWVGIDRENWGVLRAECGFDPAIPMLRQVVTTERLMALVNAVRKLDAKQAAHPYVTPEWKLKNIAAKKAADAAKVAAQVPALAPAPESTPAVPLPEASPCASTPAPMQAATAAPLDDDPATKYGSYPLMMSGNEMKTYLMENGWYMPWKVKLVLVAA